jgi:tetratricopeptide (TPR) repeat protein
LIRESGWKQSLQPIGDITRYFPFISPKERSIIESVMDEAEHYLDFSIKFAEKALSEDFANDLAYIAVFYAYRNHEWDLIEKLSVKYANVKAIKPIHLISRVYRNHDFSLIEDVISSVDDVLITNPDDWIIMEMLHTKLFLLESSQDDFLKNLEKADLHIQDNENLESYIPFIEYSRAGNYYGQGEHEQAKKHNERMFEYAKKYNLQLFSSLAYTGLATITKHYDPTKALEYLIKGDSIVRRLHNRWGLYENLFVLGTVYEIVGEQRQALESYLEASSFYHDWNLDYRTSIVYQSLGDGNAALEYAKKALNLAVNESRLKWTHLQIANVFILLDRLEEATEYLDMAREIISKNDLALTYYYSIRGKLELKKQDYLSACRTFQRALKISEQFPFIQARLRSLTGIIEAEIACYVANTQKEHLDQANLYLARLEQIATEQDLPSVLVQCAFLRAEVQMIDDQPEVAHKTLEVALDITKSSSLKSLNEKVEQRIKQLDESESKETLLQRLKDFGQMITLPTMQAKKIPFTVLGCIVMVQDGGVELYSKYVDNRLASDPTLVAALISAVSSFTSELKTGAQGQLQSIVHEDIAVLLEHGQYITGALLSDKDTYDARVLLRRFVEEFESDFANDLKTFDGSTKKFKAAENLFMVILQNREI